VSEDSTGHGYGHIVVRRGPPSDQPWVAGDTSVVYTLHKPRAHALPNIHQPVLREPATRSADAGFTDDQIAEDGRRLGLEPPWQTDPPAISAADILANCRGEHAQYRELSDHEIHSNCSKPWKRVARVFVGADVSGRVWNWLLVPATKGTDGRTPPRAVPVPQRPGDVGQPLVGECSRCHQAWVLIPGVGVPAQVVMVFPADPPTFGTVSD